MLHDVWTGMVEGAVLPLRGDVKGSANSLAGCPAPFAPLRDRGRRVVQMHRKACWAFLLNPISPAVGLCAILNHCRMALHQVIYGRRCGTCDNMLLLNADSQGCLPR